MLTIDLATKSIPSDQKIWLVHAGKNRKFYDVFLNTKKVFLDFAGLGLTGDSLESTEQIRRHVRMAKAIRKHHHEDNVLSAPSRTPSSYSELAGYDVNSDVGSIQSLFKVAKKGDLVIVTGKGYFSNLLIGEIATDFNAADTISLERYPYGKFHYRDVNWVNTKKKKSDFSQKLVEKLINRKAVISIEQYPYGVELYRHIYGSYSIGDSSKVDLYGKNYSGNDIMATDSSIKLVAYLASAYAAMEMGEEQALKDMKIDDVISRYYTSDLVENFSLNFNSPGKFELFVKSVSLAFFINISVCSLTYAGTVNPNDLNVINSAAGENASDGELDEACDKYRTLLNSISDNICDEVADLADTAKQKVGLQTSAKVTYNE